MPQAKAITLTPQANDVDYISTTESIADPWVLQLDGVTTLTQPQHVTITCTSDESGATFTVVGTDRYGNALTEAITGPNATVVVGTKNFATVTSITSTADATGVTAGVNGTCESQWYVLNYRGNDFNVGIGLDITTAGAGTAGVEHTFNNVLTQGFLEDDATVHAHDTVTGKTANFDGSYASPPVACRLSITAFTSGSITLRVVQSGNGS
tara:strand:- start:8561 stop:9190 length:630 start_codon:yes stop_codon:yes gene_type:complete